MVHALPASRAETTLRQGFDRLNPAAQGMPGMVSWADGNAGEQALLLRQIHEELAPYSVEALQAALGEEEEEREALLA